MRPINNDAFGIGLRREHVRALCVAPDNEKIDFLELTPDNWMGVGGREQQYLDEIAEKYPLVAHSLSLSIGDTLPLNREYLENIRRFLERYNITIYSDHLCYSRDEQGYLYDLLPVPRVEKAIDYLASRIDEVQDILQRPLVLENISAYYAYPGDLPELEFWQMLLDKSHCEMLLDINNVYVNSRNHGFNAEAYISALPSARIRYYHIAGHLEDHDLLLDTHGRPVAQEVLALAKYTWLCHGSRPLLLERDHHLPPLDVLYQELDHIRQVVTLTEQHHAR